MMGNTQQATDKTMAHAQKMGQMLLQVVLPQAFGWTLLVSLTNLAMAVANYTQLMGALQQEQGVTLAAFGA